jgi:hypothetical protein
MVAIIQICFREISVNFDVFIFNNVHTILNSFVDKEADEEFAGRTSYKGLVFLRTEYVSTYMYG